MNLMNLCCDADKLEKLINETPDGEVCRLSDSRYYLTRRVVIKNKSNMIIEGNGAKIITKYVNSDDYSASADAFLLFGCKSVTLRNMVFDTDVPPNVTGTVEAIDRENEHMTFVIDPKFEIHGDEVLMAINSVDEEGTFDYHIQHYAFHPDPDIVTMIQGEILLANTYTSAPKDYLGNNRFKVYLPLRDNYQKLTVGSRLCIRHTMYGPSTITIKESDDTVLEDITMYAAAGMAVMVLPRCNNLVIDGLKMLRREDGSVFMAGNCDGVHITGLSGKFTMRNCVFDGLGDDALNIHSTAGTITAVYPEENRIKCNYCKKTEDGKLSAKWCQKGDTVKVFTLPSMKVAATLKVQSFEDGFLSYELIDGEVEVGCELQNMAFAPSCEIDNCIVKNTRARAFIIQTPNVEIKNCTLFGMSFNAIKVAPAFEYWHEVGPVDNLYIHDNKIEKCNWANTSVPAIGVYTSHRGNDESVTGLHRNIRIENNVFTRAEGLCINVSSSDGVTVKGNRFVDRQKREIAPVEMVSCTMVSVSDNQDI